MSVSFLCVHALQPATGSCAQNCLVGCSQGLTPNVVFAEAWTPLGNDKFLMFYGAADTYVGAAIVSVKISS